MSCADRPGPRQPLPPPAWTLCSRLPEAESTAPMSRNEDPFPTVSLVTPKDRGLCLAGTRRRLLSPGSGAGVGGSLQGVWGLHVRPSPRPTVSPSGSREREPPPRGRRTGRSGERCGPARRALPLWAPTSKSIFSYPVSLCLSNTSLWHAPVTACGTPTRPGWGSGEPGGERGLGGSTLRPQGCRNSSGAVSTAV